MAPPLPESLQASIAATKVDYVRLGASGLRVSVPILGAMSLGSPEWIPWVLDEDASVAVLKAAYDIGINSWDTADMYSNGLSERAIGRALREHAIPRERVVLMTKCMFHIPDEPGLHTVPFFDQLAQSKDYVNRGGLSRSAIFKAVEASLHRLGTDYIDVYIIHRFDYSTPIEETMKALHDLVQAGKVRYLGASSMWATQFAQMQALAERRGWTPFVSMQNLHNLLYREEEREMMRFCAATGVALTPYSTNSGGKLLRPVGSAEAAKSVRANTPSPFGDELSEADKEIIGRVEKVAGDKGWSMMQVVMAWQRAKGTIPIVGFNSVARVQEAAGFRGKELAEEEIKFLEEPYVPKNVIAHV